MIAQLSKPFSVCELGDQLYHLYKNPPGRKGKRKNRRPAREWYAKRGCDRYEALDANGRGTMRVDLNEPLKVYHDYAEAFAKGHLIEINEVPPGFLRSFHLVTDFGTGEHIFDHAQVWRTLHNLLMPGGFLVLERPHQGHLDHGFINTQPTLIHDVAHANGYTVVSLEIGEVRRGQVIRAALRKSSHGEFRAPTQGKYRKELDR